jgi:hypothetical protein
MRPVRGAVWIESKKYIEFLKSAPVGGLVWVESKKYIESLKSAPVGVSSG